MPIRNTKNINLLPQDDFDSSTFGRIVKWALSSFRVMVIVTELVVMGAFLSRFWLDARNSDLNEELGLLKSQVIAYSSLEDDFRVYQKKISIAKTLYDESPKNEILNEITMLIPDEITLTSFQVSNSGLQIKAVALSERSIAQFLVNLNSYSKITDVNLSQVSSSVDNSFLTTFTINAKVLK